MIGGMNLPVCFFDAFLAGSDAGAGNGGGVRLIAEAEDSFSPDLGKGGGAILASDGEPMGAPESEVQRDASVFGGNLISVGASGRINVLLAETCFAGKGGGRGTFCEGGAGVGIGDESANGTESSDDVPMGGALATEESITTTFPAEVLFRGWAVGKAVGDLGPAPLSEGNGG